MRLSITSLRDEFQQTRGTTVSRRVETGPHSGTPSRTYLEAFVRAGLGKRLMFGSDQMRWPEKIGKGIEAVEQAPFLTEEQKRDILYHNAVRFLRLEQEPESLSPGAQAVSSGG